VILNKKTHDTIDDFLSFNHTANDSNIDIKTEEVIMQTTPQQLMREFDRSIVLKCYLARAGYNLSSEVLLDALAAACGQGNWRDFEIAVDWKSSESATVVLDDMLQVLAGIGS
jgi:hypothetical protein